MKPYIFLYPLDGSKKICGNPRDQGGRKQIERG